ncbi:MAG: SulP family inorganic anion transporter [Dethiobacter sp.]|jgi:SulP family sulfate permease|nr:SulP family inorganic anion transporter [Dethiobacter sp.]MBS3902520.1 SulP family inorganic anion transporter [Dethiobacter sp.]MBS3990000.1 SulP family inorganic anion transporter [Dethiobacter sp.]
MKFFDFSNLRGDVFGGLTAGIVALPLALAFGEASGAGPMAGLWGAIFVGFFAALFGGTGSQVSGPTGPMVIVFAGIYGKLAGDPVLVFSAVFFAGLIQIVLGLLKVGKYISLVPYPVVSGFMSGIGCIIIALQLSRLFGHEPLAGGTLPALSAIPGAIANPVFPALLVGLIALAIVFLWPKAWVKWFPGPLAALLIGTVISRFVPGAPILGDIPTGFPRIYFPTLSFQFLPIVIESIIILAVLGGIDSLLTSLVADNMTRTRHRSNQELIGQGIGNAFAGIFGGVPGAGATMRTVVNIHNGGRTKLSGMTHSFVLLAIVLAFGPLAGKIPHAVLAGILIKVGYDIIDRYFLQRAGSSPRWDLFLMLLVLALTVFVDLITAVLVGALLSAILFVKRMADFQLTQFCATNSSHSDPKVRALLEVACSCVTLLEFNGPLSFAVIADFEQMMRERLKDDKEFIILDFSNMPQIDLSATRAVETIIFDALDRGKRVYLTGMSAKVNSVIRSFCDQQCISDGMCFETSVEALEAVISSREELCCLQHASAART